MGFTQFSSPVRGQRLSPRQGARSPDLQPGRGAPVTAASPRSAAPQPGGLPLWPPKPAPGALGRAGHLQPAAELLHRAPAGGHRVAQQEHRDAPLPNQPPQHRILSLPEPATEWKGGRCQSGISVTPHGTAPPLACSQTASAIKGISQVAKKKKKKKNFLLEPFSTYLFRNQLLQLCFFQTTQAKRDRKGGEKSEALPLI